MEPEETESTLDRDDDERRGQQPGSDVGDDRDVPEDPLLAPPSEDETPDLADRRSADDS